MAHWVKAGVVENRFEGDRVAQTLKEAEIPFMIKSFHDTAYDGLYIPQKGLGWSWFLRTYAKRWRGCL